MKKMLIKLISFNNVPFVLCIYLKNNKKKKEKAKIKMNGN